MTTALETGTKATVGMGQIVAARPPNSLSSVLGSCVGVALYHPRSKLGILAHVVLPDSAGREGPPGKFADTAIAAMVKQFAQDGVSANALVARIAGGANMFGSANGPLQIGELNIQAVQKLLEAAKIRLLGQHLGGTKGRRIFFNCETGSVTIEVVGSQPETI